MPRKRLPPEVLDFFQKSGSQGGKKTVKKYGRKQMAEWGKLGGRPRLDSCKQPNQTRWIRMAVYKRSDVYWYEFIFAGKRIRESSKSTSKTVAREAEKTGVESWRKRWQECLRSKGKIAFAP